MLLMALVSIGCAAFLIIYIFGAMFITKVLRGPWWYVAFWPVIWPVMFVCERINRMWRK